MPLQARPVLNAGHTDTPAADRLSASAPERRSSSGREGRILLVEDNNINMNVSNPLLR